MKRRWPAACLGMVLAFTTAAAQAGGGWQVDFSYGGGGHHHHYHPCHGPYWYPRPWYGFTYVAPPPVVYAAPAVVTVPTLTSVPVATTPVAAAAPQPAATTVVRSNPSPAARTAGVTLRNPAASGTTLTFVVDSRTEVELQPGETVPLVEKNAYFVEFDRGGEFGTSKRTLTEGTYEFVATESGWDLRRADATDSIPTPVVRRNTLPTVK